MTTRVCDAELRLRALQPDVGEVVEAAVVQAARVGRETDLERGGAWVVVVDPDDDFFDPQPGRDERESRDEGDCGESLHEASEVLDYGTKTYGGFYFARGRSPSR